MTAYVIGAGLAGLSAAVRLAAAGERVVVLEASAQAGGRCRSYRDPVLDMTLDNGNHLVLSGNAETFAYLGLLGVQDRLVGPEDMRLDFHDLRDGARWTLRPNLGPVPWWILAPDRRVPATRAADYLGLARLATARAGRIDGATSCHGPLWDRLLEPFLLAALNTEAAAGSAKLAAEVIARSLARGGRAYRPRVAWPNLSAAFIQPALDFLGVRGGQVSFGSPVRGLEFDGGRLRAIALAEEKIDLHARDLAVLAAPAWICGELVPDLVVPDAFNAIVNGHFRMSPPAGLAPIVGVVGGTAQWIFAFEDRLSVTVSAAGDMADQDREQLAQAFWADICAVHGLTGPAPPWRIVKERRATFAATPEQDARRPPATTAWPNLLLAGDWTATGLPSTIEGAIGSGAQAARLALSLAGRS